MRGVLVNAVHDAVHIFKHGTETGAGGMELRAQLLGTAGELFCLADDFS